MPKILIYPEPNPRGVLSSRRQLDRLEAAGKFLRRVQISPGRVGWLVEIEAHDAAKIANRRARLGLTAEITA